MVRQGVDRGLVEVQLGGVFDGAVMVNLTPVMIQHTKDARRAEGQIGNGGWRFEPASFAADGVEEFAGDVQRIVGELGGDAGWAGKEPFVDPADFGPAAFDAAEGVVHGDFFEGRPILSHENDVLGIKCAIKLSESVTGMCQIAKVFVAGDGIERG